MTSLPALISEAGRLQDTERLTAANALQDALRSAHEFSLGEKADRTRAAYAAAFRDFERFCATVERSPLPAEPSTVAAYLAHLAERRLRPSTIQQRLSAIRYLHKLRGLDAPTA